MDPGLAPATSRDVDADREGWSEFLAPGPFGEVEASLYQFDTSASPPVALEAWMAAQPLAERDSTAALVLDRSETRLRAVASDQMGPAGQELAGYVTLIVVGLHQLCWRCDQMTVCVVGFTRPGRLSVSDVVRAEDVGLLSWAAQLVPEEVRRGEQVGVIKARFSRTAHRSYVSNGCFHCDALQGAVPLGQSFLAQAAAWGETVKRMPAVHQVQLPVGWWEQLLRDHPVRP